MSPALKRSIRLAVRRWAQKPDPLAVKVILKATIAACTENGLVALCRSGRDCDGVSYSSVDHIPAPGLMAFITSQADHEAWLDGPENTWFAKPSDEPEGYAQYSCGWER